MMPTRLMSLHAQDGNLERSLKALQQSLELSSKLEEASGDVDVLGAIGDLYTDLGDLERAAEASCTHIFQAVHNEESQTAPAREWQVFYNQVDGLTRC